ncbi:spore coat protein [uncultured Ruthenibacterium sp.]|uniref:spore coat protein n=1 Tax=uncultured Ruthenibacterium sp. TaxID=1905347 RepID=UPI00349EDF95
MGEIMSIEELSCFSKLLLYERTSVKKYKAYAQTCEDLALKELYEDIIQRQIEHYNSLLEELQRQGEI